MKGDEHQPNKCTSRVDTNDVSSIGHLVWKIANDATIRTTQILHSGGRSRGYNIRIQGYIVQPSCTYQPRFLYVSSRARHRMCDEVSELHYTTHHESVGHRPLQHKRVRQAPAFHFQHIHLNAVGPVLDRLHEMKMTSAK